MQKSSANSKFPSRLKAARIACGLTQQKAADSFSITLRGYCKWEAGQSEPSLSTVALIARTLGVSADWLLGLTDER